jgi:ADP-ribose pyrophosphatase
MLESMGRYMLMQGGCDEVVEIFCARVRLDAAAGGTFGLASEHEDIRLLAMPAEDAFALLDEQRIRNATGALALMWLRHHRARLRASWGS